MKNKIIASLLAGFLALPIVVVAAYKSPDLPLGGQTIDSLVNEILRFLWQLTAAFGVIMVLVAGALFIAANGNPEGIGKARMALLWAIVGLVVAAIAFSLPTILNGIII